MPKFEIFVALRYLRSRKRHKSLSLNTLISTAGVAVGVMALLTVLAVMTGFHQDLQSKILGVSTHVVVLDYRGTMDNYGSVMKRLEGEQQVLSASPFVLGQAMVSTGERAQGIYVRGIDPALERKTTEFERNLMQGSIDGLANVPEGGQEGIVIGASLAEMLGVTKGDTLKLISPFGGMGPMGNLPRVKKFTVVGIFNIGMYEYDMNLALIAMQPAREFFDVPDDAITGIELKIKDVYAANSYAKELKERLGFPFYTKDWIQMNHNLFSALKLEKFAMFVILTLIVLVAAFNIVSTQTMNVMEKEHEIAILKAMGADNRSIMAIFMLQGFFIGLVGTLVGLIGGIGLSYAIDKYELITLPGDVYYLDHLPARIIATDFLAVTISAVLISFLATLYPAWRASKLDPVEPLRYE